MELTVTASQYSVNSPANSVVKMTFHYLMPDTLEPGSLFYTNRNKAFPKVSLTVKEYLESDGALATSHKFVSLLNKLLI